MSLNDTLSEHELLASLLDTEQFDDPALDTSAGAQHFQLPAGARLVLRRHEIHRTDKLPDGGEELITSTLKFFQLEVALVDDDDLPIFDADGTKVRATLLYENGRAAEEQSVSLEPPLLGGEAVLEGGVATLRMRITILSSLCNAKRFRVHVALAERADISATSQATKTITKLRRTSRGGAKAAAAAAAACFAEDDDDTDTALMPPPTSPNHDAAAQRPAPSAKRALSASAEKGPLAKGASKEVVLGSNATPTCGAKARDVEAATADAQSRLRSLASLWDEVESNRKQLSELQDQQRLLFAELRRMRDKTHGSLAALTAPTALVAAAADVAGSHAAAHTSVGV